jgi:hypothetical protein
MTLPEILAILEKPFSGSRVKDWTSLGPDPVYFYWGSEQVSIASAIVLEESGQTLAVELFTPDGVFRWIEPDYRDSFFEECRERGIDTRTNELGLPYIEITEATRWLDIAGTAMGRKQTG